MYSVFYEMSLSTAAASVLSAACSMATQKALSPRRHFRGRTRLPHDEARSVYRAGVNESEMFSGSMKKNAVQFL